MSEPEGRLDAVLRIIENPNLHMGPTVSFVLGAVQSPIGAPPEDESARHPEYEEPHRYIADCAARPGGSYPVVQRYQGVQRDDHAIHRWPSLGR